MNHIVDIHLFIWGKIGTYLEDARRRVHDEISRYPMPIPACDAHFNHLLEVRARICDEIDRLQTAVKESVGRGHPIELIEEFIRSSGCLDNKAKQELRALFAQSAI